MSPGLHDLLEHPELITSIPLDTIPAILGDIEAFRIRLLARLITSQTPTTPTDETAQPTDRLLDPAQAAALMGVKIRWLYQHHRTLPFARKLSRRALRFDEAGLHRWLAHRHV
jgi:predicted DNA-binding transcriptional regulator AlpA